MTTRVDPAWLLAGLGHTPGVVALRGGRLSFTTDDGVVFDEPLERVKTAFPWYWFGGGFRADVVGTRWKISLTRPEGAPRPSAGLLRLGGLDGGLGAAAGSLADVAEGRRRGRAWREVLSG